IVGKVLSPREFGLLACWLRLSAARPSEEKDRGDGCRTLHEATPFLMEISRVSHPTAPPSGYNQDRALPTRLPRERETKTGAVLLELSPTRKQPAARRTVLLVRKGG